MKAIIKNYVLLQIGSILIKTAITTSLHQLQSAHLSPSMMKRAALSKEIYSLQHLYVSSVVIFWSAILPKAAQMFYKVLVYTNVCVRYVTETVLKYQDWPCDRSVLNF